MSTSTHSHAGSQQSPGNYTLEQALQIVVDTYHQYSVRQGDIDHLSMSDFRTLLREQAPSFLEICDRNLLAYMDKLLQESDLDKDEELNFEEFAIVMSKLTDDAHRIRHGSERCGPDKD